MRYTAFLLGTLFIALKVFSVISWSWWWVFSPWLAILFVYMCVWFGIIWLVICYVKSGPERKRKVQEFISKLEKGK